MKYFVSLSAIVSSTTLAISPKCRSGFLRALVAGVLVGIAFLSVQPCVLAATISPSSLSWATVQLGNTGGPKSTTLTNNSASAITIKSTVVGGTNPSDFVISAKTCVSTLGASASCSVTIRFKPVAVGIRKATLTISDTATNTTQTVALSGTGILS